MEGKTGNNPGKTNGFDPLSPIVPSPQFSVFWGGTGHAQNHYTISLLPFLFFYIGEEDFPKRSNLPSSFLRNEETKGMATRKTSCTVVRL